MLRLILSGAFDRCPNLQLIIGHSGETLPYMMQRLEVALPKEMTNLDRFFADYLRANAYYTVAGFNYTAPFLALVLQVGVDRIMFSTDYPYSSMAAACAFLHNVPLSAADKARVAHGNAKALLPL